MLGLTHIVVSHSSTEGWNGVNPFQHMSQVQKFSYYVALSVNMRLGYSFENKNKGVILLQNIFIYISMRYILFPEGNGLKIKE